MKKSCFFEWYYILVILAYIATMFSALARPGVFAVILMGIITILLFVRKKMNIHSVMDVLIVLYFLYKLVTIVCIIKSGMPLRVYTGEVAVSLVPMIFYFVGDKVSDRREDFYKKFLWAIFILGLVSLILYIFAPQSYCDYLYNWSYISKADASTARVRMQSVVGSTMFGAIMILAMAVSTYFIGREGKDTGARKTRAFGMFSLAFSLVFAFLSNQRACMVTAIIIVIYVCFIAYSRNKSIPTKYIIIGLVGVAIAFILICIVRFDFVLKVWWRLESLPRAISERSEQWVAAVNNMYSSWFGNGLGANGHKALGIDGAHVIADGGLIKLYCEEGVLGFSLFVYIIFLTLKKGIKGLDDYCAEVCIIASVLLLSIGSNILAFQLATPILWYAVGSVFADYDGFELDFSALLEKRG